MSRASEFKRIIDPKTDQFTAGFLKMDFEKKYPAKKKKKAKKTTTRRKKRRSIFDW